MSGTNGTADGALRRARAALPEGSTRSRRAGVALLCAAWGLVACSKEKPKPEPEEPLVDASLEIGPKAPSERKGMVWIEPGALVAGTAPTAFPRVADAEMPGEQVILRGFYIDVFPYPNEQGAIPLTNVSQEEAKTHCEEQGKRLCTELEWERACKGPKNRVYEYGDTYKPERCNTGAPPRMLPSGMLYGCRSDFGVRDLHGGVWEWTSSRYGRGVSAEKELGSLRGGNSTAGELVGRCANVASSPVDRRAGTVGFRCCAGETNPAEVVLRVQRGAPLSAHTKLEKDLSRKLEALLPEAAEKDLGTRKGFKLQRMWTWRPIGNEELLVAGGCVGLASEPRCGVIVARMVLDEPKFLGWAGSGHWAPNVQTDVDPRDLWLFGGDKAGQFKRLVGYVWGRVSIGLIERNLPKDDDDKKSKKKKKKR
ncbi:MAG: SUMF1/EgtB/PvdO family nonheme iron enzyme [Polyangiaceae bacterium]